MRKLKVLFGKTKKLVIYAKVTHVDPKRLGVNECVAVPHRKVLAET
jgi:hypothetical protein